MPQRRLVSGIRPVKSGGLNGLSGGLLRFATAGSVDDGKSTLIGRLLVDTRGAYEDQVAAAQRDNERRGGHGIDFALLTDGLKAEREQGIMA